MRQAVVVLALMLVSMVTKGASLEEALPPSHQGFQSAKFIVFIAHGTSCPMVSRYYPKVTSLEKRFGSKNIAFVYVNPSAHDSVKSIEAEFKKFRVKTKYIYDETQKLGRFLGMKTTTQAVVYDNKRKAIRYSGAIDDAIKFDVQLDFPKNDYVKDQLDLLLVGKDPTISESDVFGCSITYNN